MSTIASASICNVNLWIKSLIICGCTVLTSIRISYFMIHSPCFNIAQNVISSSFGGSDYLPQISSKCVQYCCEWKEMPMLAQARQRENEA